MGQIDFITSNFVRIYFSKLSGKHFADHTLQMHMLISPHCLCIQPDVQTVEISVCIYVPFDCAVFIKLHFGTSSVILTRLQCTAWLGFSVFANSYNLKLTSFCVIITVLFRVLKIKQIFGENNISDCNFLSSSYGNESQKSGGYAKYTTLNMVLFLQLIG